MQQPIQNYNVLFKEIKKLGEGNYGEVFLAENLSVPGIPIGQQVAVKLIDITKSKQSDILRIKQELNILQTLSATGCTKGILCYYTTVTVLKGNKLYQAVVTEYLKGETLEQVIENIESAGSGIYNINTSLTNKQIQNIIGFLIETLGIIHSAGVVHRDIKPENIFVEHNGIKYIDFGLLCSINVNNITCRKTMTGTPFYMDINLRNWTDPKSPLTANDLEALKKADIWSLGMTLYNFIFGQLPSDSSVDSIDSYFKGINETVFDFKDSPFKPVLEKMLEKNANLRTLNTNELLDILDTIKI